ncbi:branched-chain amino acid transport system ATP-binding protein [Pseudomonas sp. BIGb0408]|uniref:Branched-chain amino acid transport system ATP-binding protein n=1 Tax=Phytopseudomonas flavescens TaxID=29435 RepID=A0A7Z0BPG6_9GAMM|nr:MULTISPECIES: ABC transporter ATP-binding protein [Pseudomonas]MCW2293331.1 branched-chain amino acid transport system ATP-binding protein [Pseudomonas sp. BIGb0408]NYH72098.1 branched-chain amino acid transport system ATP-binding protein [Pseudomonas flavescens]
MNQARGPVVQSSELLVVDDIEVIYDGAILAVDGVSLRVEQGGIVALLGANGAGKSTTLKAISGLVQADRARVSRGNIRLRGGSTAGIAANLLARQGVVHVLEGRHVFAHLSIEDNLRTGGFLRNPGRRELEAELERIYAWFPRLKTKRKTQAGLTSGGEQQMLAIGRALMTRPSLVLLDEPSMGLAPIIVEEIFEIVSQLNAREGVSFLVAEQNINVALRHASYGYILENGRVVGEGNAEQLASRDDLQHFYLGGKAG